MPHTLLIVSSDRTDISAAGSAAAEQAVETITAQTYREAVTAISRKAFALIFCEHSLHDGNWKDLLSRLIITPEPPPLVVVADANLRSVWAVCSSLRR